MLPFLSLISVDRWAFSKVLGLGFVDAYRHKYPDAREEVGSTPIGDNFAFYFLDFEGDLQSIFRFHRTLLLCSFSPFFLNDVFLQDSILSRTIQSSNPLLSHL